MQIAVTEFVDEWIAEHYPHAVFFLNAGEVGVMLGIDESGNDCF